MCQQALPQGAASERSVQETMRQFPHGISEQRRGTAGAIPPVVYGGFKSTGTRSVAAHLLSTCRWTPRVLLANAGFFFFFFLIYSHVLTTMITTNKDNKDWLPSRVH